MEYRLHISSSESEAKHAYSFDGLMQEPVSPYELSSEALEFTQGASVHRKIPVDGRPAVKTYKLKSVLFLPPN